MLAQDRARLTTANVANCGLPALFLDDLETAWPGAWCAGPARTLAGVGGDNLGLHRVLAQARRGEVIVADVGGRRDVGHWGDVLSTAALAQGVAGLVITGGVRDVLRISELGFPVFHAGRSPRAAAKDAPGEVDAVLWATDGAPVAPGDLVVADDDGVAVVSGRVALEQVLDAVKEVEGRERVLLHRIAAGESLAEVTGWAG